MITLATGILGRCHTRKGARAFGELVIVRGQPHVGIVRLVNLSAAQHGPTTVQVVQRCEAGLGAGAIVTVEPGQSGYDPGTEAP